MPSEFSRRHNTLVMPLSSSRVAAPSMSPLCMHVVSDVVLLTTGSAAYQAKLGRLFSIVFPLPPRCAYKSKSILNT